MNEDVPWADNPLKKIETEVDTETTFRIMQRLRELQKELDEMLGVEPISIEERRKRRKEREGF